MPSVGTSDNNRVSDNYRRLGDIYVEEEDNPKLSYNQVQELVRRRTVNRHVLAGLHTAAVDVIGEDDGVFTGIVGDEIYDRNTYEDEFYDDDGAGSLRAFRLLVGGGVLLLLLLVRH